MKPHLRLINPDPEHLIPKHARETQWERSGWTAIVTLLCGAVLLFVWLLC